VIPLGNYQISKINNRQLLLMLFIIMILFKNIIDDSHDIELFSKNLILLMCKVETNLSHDFINNNFY